MLQGIYLEIHHRWTSRGLVLAMGVTETVAVGVTDTITTEATIHEETAEEVIEEVEDVVEAVSEAVGAVQNPESAINSEMDTAHTEIVADFRTKCRRRTGLVFT